MRSLSRRQQVVLVLIVVGTAAIVSLLVGLLAAAGPRQDGVAPSPLPGLSLGIVAGAIYVGLAGNRKMSLADAATRAAALAPVGGGSTCVIVFRQGFVAKLQGIDVLVDGTVRTQLKSPRFAVLAMAPGERMVETQMMGKRSEPLRLTLAAGETVAVQVHVGLGKARPERRLDVDAVRAALAATPMVVAS